MAQTWEDLVFAHWPLPIELLRRVVPAVIPLDTFDGQAWLGVTPFKVGVIRPRGFPHIPRVSEFNEINVRTYTTIDGKPGIWFLSLDASSRLAVIAARRTYRLPYFHAAIALRRHGSAIDFSTHRTSLDGPPAELTARYQPTGPVRIAAPGTLEHFLSERYCLYNLDQHQHIYRADIHHPPWPLQPATAKLDRNSMGAPYGIQLTTDPLLHFARRQDVIFWMPRRLNPDR